MNRKTEQYKKLRDRTGQIDPVTERALAETEGIDILRRGARPSELVSTDPK
jgi:hypothetical protein